jgi:hypothetical protein
MSGVISLRWKRARAAGVGARSGVNGDPTRATGQKGERVTEAEAVLLAEIDALASAPVPGGTPRSPLDDEPR